MRRKNIIFGVIGFALTLVTGGHAFAALGQNEISMGMFSIPLPVNGNDGCTPAITVTAKGANGCYTTTIQKKVLQNGSCEDDGQAIERETCDGEDGAGGAVNVTKEYVPYPASTFNGNEPQNEGYIKVTIPAADDGEDDTILKYPDYCEEFYEDGLTKKKCTAQGDATDWANTSGGSPYQTGDNYIFSIDGVEDGYPRLEYVRPVLSSGTSGYPTEPGYTKDVTRYKNGREQSDLVAIDSCDKYAKSTDTSDRVTKCTVGAPAGTPGATSPYTPGVTYCLGNHLSDCNQYTIPVGAVDVCAGLTSSDNAWETTVTATESEYVAHAYNDQCTTNCTGTVGYKLTKETMCDGNIRENKVYDTCVSATAPSNVTCATGYAYQTCTPVDLRGGSNSYSGCFPDPLSGLYAHKDDIVPADFAADSNYLYYCKVANCKVAVCWVDDTIGGTPYYNDGNGCWGRVSINGLQGADGKSCFVTNDGTNWNMCCSPSYAGNDCSIITDQDIIDKLTGMMCQVNYEHKYLHADGNNGFTANTTKEGARGERVIVTNTCNDDTENLDTYYGEDATIEEESGWPKIIYFAPQKVDSTSGGMLVKPGYTKVQHKYLRDNGATTMDDAQTDDSPCITVSKQTRTANGNTVTTNKSTVQKCQIQSYDALSSSSTGTWTTGNWYCLNTNATGSCEGYSENVSDTVTSTLKYHLPTMAGTSGNAATTPVSPGWTYYEEKDAGSVVVRNTERNKDECELLTTRTTSGNTTSTTSVWRCTVGAPVGTSGLTTTYYAGATYCLNYANGTCPSSLTDIGAAIDDAADNDPCNGSTSATAVKKVVSRTYTRTTDSQGVLTSVYKMCNDDDHAETTPDECYEIPTPAGETCTNGVWMQCKRQADEGTVSATARGTTYGYCATYPQCVGNENSTTIVKKTERAYTAPTKTGTNSYYDTPGKMVTNKIPCSSSASAIVDSSEDDQCEEIPDTGSICPTDKKVLKKCKRKGDESSTLRAESAYNLCTTGTSIFGAISDNDPCEGDTTSDDSKKRVKKIEYEYVTPVTGNQAKRVGYSVKTTTMCHITNGVHDTSTEYIYDTCEPAEASDSCKNGTTYKPYYKCYKQTYDATSANQSNREYNACDPLSAAVALSSAVANKLDSDVEFTIGTHDNKEYILMSAGGVTNKPVVAVDDLKPQSLLDIWKEQYTNLNDTKCEALFGSGKKCGTDGNNLTNADMLDNMSAYGVWKTNQVKGGQTNSDNLTFAKYQQSLQPCQTFDISEDETYTGNDGKRYTMTCVQ